MKLANHLTTRLVALLLLVLAVWSVIYFVMQMHEIYDDIDEGLTNLKQEFIVQANTDPAFVDMMLAYNPINMKVEEISYGEALDIKEEHITTEIYFPTEQEHEEVRMLITAFRCEPNGKYYRIKFFTSTVESDDLIENMIFLQITLWIALVSVMFFGGRRIINRTNKSFYKLLTELKNFELDQSKMIEIPQSDISEYKALNKAVETLLEKNIQTYKEQKVFIENASHELQTPIAVIISRIELMMNSQDISERHLSDLATILANLNRMKRLNSSLLLLSKIRNRQFVDATKINLRKAIDDVYENFKDIIEHRELKFNIEEEGNPNILMNKDLAHILINNLIKNAVNYNIPLGKTNIKLTPNSLTIANDGEEIKENINIFDRYTSFTTSDSSSTGLGLAIVSSIAELYQFRIEYNYDGMHTIVLRF